MIDSVYRKDKNYYPQVLLEECKYVVKEKKVSNYIAHDMNISSDDFDRENSDYSDEENLRANIRNQLGFFCLILKSSLSKQNQQSSHVIRIFLFYA